MQRFSRADGSTAAFFDDHTGSIRSTVYTPFPGAALVQKDVHMPQFSTNWRYESTNALAIEYCREGRLECQIEDEHMYITPGDILIFRTDPNQRTLHYPSSHYHATSFWVLLDEPSPVLELHLGMAGFTLEMLMEKYLPDGRYYSILKHTELLTNVFETIIRAPESVRNMLYGVKILEALLLLASDAVQKNECPARRISKHHADMAKCVYTYVMEHPEEHFTIDDLARTFSISSTQLKKCFQIAYGTSMQKFIREQKIKAAAKVLETTDKKVTEVALMFGYSNTSKFANTFKTITGVYPKQYSLHHYTPLDDEPKNV